MKTLKQIREAKSGGKEAYQKFFNSLLKKFGVSSPSELEGDQKKKFYDELDAGWESDDPNDKNERYEDPEGLDPETTHDSDEDMADKAASQVNASYGKMNAGYIKSAYHKEDVNHPKPLSIIRSNKLSGDALEEAYDMNEKMVMCEQCGKMHEEGACMETDNDLDPETKGMEEANRLSIKLKGDASKLFDLAKKQGIKNKAYGDKEWNKAVDQAAAEMGKKVNFKDIAAVKQAMMHESIKEAKEAKLSPSMKNQIHKIAKKHSGDMEAAMKEISKMKVWKGQGIKDHSYVMDTLKRANETYDYGSDKAVKAAKKKTPGQKNESVDVDRRTKGFKEAMKRAEAAKKKREAYKKKKEAKKDQAELDARYDYDGEVDTILAAASKVMMGTNETAANAVAHGGVDMAPNAGKKKKKELLARRGY